jgi:hypothetical protein
MPRDTANEAVLSALTIADCEAARARSPALILDQPGVTPIRFRIREERRRTTDHLRVGVKHRPSPFS